MTILESQFEEVADAIDAGEVLHHEYDLKINILMKVALATIPGKEFLATTLKILHESAKHGEVIEIFDINNNQVKPDLTDIDPKDIEQTFCVEVGGRGNQIFMFGMKIQSTMPYSALKARVDGQLKARSTYISLHRGGFNHGVNWTTLGFFTGKHPKFVNHEAIRQDIIQKFASGWKNHSTYWTADKKKEIQRQLHTKATPFDPTEFPFLVTSMITTTKDTTVRSYTVSIIAPHKFSRAGRMIMDYVLLTAKKLPNYVPTAFQYEDPIAFRNILSAHDLWMDNHRNIQIRNIQSVDYLTDQPATDGKTLKDLLTANPNILDFNFDSKHSRLNISVDRKNFATTSNTLSEQISAANFPFHPTVRRVTTYSSNNSQGSTTTAATKYSEILSGMISSATSHASVYEEYTSTNRRNAWKKNVPSTIDFYGNTSADFPPLRPSNPTTDNQSHETTSDKITASTLQSAIKEALAEVQQKHNAEIQAMKNDYKKFQAEISSLREQLAQRENSDTNRLERKIDLLMHHLHLGSGNQVPTPNDPVPSPSRKKPRNERSDSPDQTGPTSPPDNSGWVFDDDDNVPSSQDGAEASSGSEE